MVELSEEETLFVERARACLQEEVEVEDPLTGETRIEIRESQAMTVYKEKRIAYENAVIDYARRLARARNGTAEERVEWSHIGEIYEQRALNALRDWIASGHKREIEQAQEAITQILGTGMVPWIQINAKVGLLKCGKPGGPPEGFPHFNSLCYDDWPSFRLSTGPLFI